MKKPTIIIDTREKKPFIFPGIPIERKKLNVGDYSLKGVRENKIIIERKSLMDLFNTLTKRKDAFSKQLSIMGEYYGFAAVIIEADCSRISAGLKQTRVNGDFILEELFRICMLQKVSPILCNSRLEARIMTQKLLLTYWKHF